jgi:hypothetical protein
LVKWPGRDRTWGVGVAGIHPQSTACVWLAEPCLPSRDIQRSQHIDNGAHCGSVLISAGLHTCRCRHSTGERRGSDYAIPGLGPFHRQNPKTLNPKLGSPILLSSLIVWKCFTGAADPSNRHGMHVGVCWLGWQDAAVSGGMAGEYSFAHIGSKGTGVQPGAEEASTGSALEVRALTTMPCCSRAHFLLI